MCRNNLRVSGGLSGGFAVTHGQDHCGCTTYNVASGNDIGKIGHTGSINIDVTPFVQGQVGTGAGK